MSNEFWVAFFGAVTAIACAAIPLIYKYLALVESIKSQKREVDAQKAIARAQSSTICDLQDEACRAQALAIHATGEVVAVREDVRKEQEETREKFHALSQRTDVWMAQATTPGDSGRPPLKALTDFGGLTLEDKP